MGASTLLLAATLLLSIVIASGNAPVKVTVSLRGRKYEIEAATVADMQSQIEKEADLPVSQQSVLFKGKSLDSGATLTDAGVADGDAVLVVPLKKAVPRKSSVLPDPSPMTLDDDSDAGGAAGGGSAAAAPAAVGGAGGMGGMGGMAGLPGMGGAGAAGGGGMGGLASMLGGGGMPNMDDMTPEQMQEAVSQLYDSPIFEEFLGSKEKIEEARQAILANPMLMGMMKELPGFGDIINDKDAWCERMEASREMIKMVKEGGSIPGMPGMGGAGAGEAIDDFSDGDEL